MGWRLALEWHEAVGPGGAVAASFRGTRGARHGHSGKWIGDKDWRQGLATRTRDKSKKHRYTAPSKRAFPRHPSSPIDHADNSPGGAASATPSR